MAETYLPLKNKSNSSFLNESGVSSTKAHPISVQRRMCSCAATHPHVPGTKLPALNSLQRLTCHCGVMGRQSPELVIYSFHRKTRESWWQMAAADLGGVPQAGLVLQHEPHLSPPASRRTAAPERPIGWSVLPNAVGDARGSPRERLLLFIIIGFDHGRQNPNEPLTK